MYATTTLVPVRQSFEEPGRRQANEYAPLLTHPLLGGLERNDWHLDSPQRGRLLVGFARPNDPRLQATHPYLQAYRDTYGCWPRLIGEPVDPRVVIEEAALAALRLTAQRNDERLELQLVRCDDGPGQTWQDPLVGPAQLRRVGDAELFAVLGQGLIVGPNGVTVLAAYTAGERTGTHANEGLERALEEAFG